MTHLKTLWSKNQLLKEKYMTIFRMQRLKEVVRALPRVKLEHIQPDFNPEPAPLKRPSKKILKLYSKNSPIFLWDGSPLSSVTKPSIGAEHRFTRG